MAHPLLEAFPQPKDLLAVQPEDLAGVLIEVLPSLMQAAGFEFGALQQAFYPMQGGGYPPMSQGEVNLVIAEALAWLEQQGLLMRNPNQPNYHWYVLTRRGAEIKTRGQLESYVRGRDLPVDLLQPELVVVVRPLFLRGDYDTAVFQAFKMVEMVVRSASSCPPEWPAQKVMRTAFNPVDGVLTDKDLPDGERQAMSDLYAGAMGHAKNPPSHRDVKMHRMEAARLIIFGGYLLDLAQFRHMLS